MTAKWIAVKKHGMVTLSDEEQERLNALIDTYGQTPCPGSCTCATGTAVS